MRELIEDAQMCVSFILDKAFRLDQPKSLSSTSSLSLPIMTIAWVIAALDYVMTGNGKVNREHKKFINAALACDLSVGNFNAAASTDYVEGVVFDPTILPAFMLLAENLEPGLASELYSPLTYLLHLASAADGVRDMQEMERIESVLTPIRQHFALDSYVAFPRDLPEPVAIANTPTKANDRAKHKPAPLTSVNKPGQALVELERLVGLASVKKEVRNITNMAYYLIQRRAAGLPAPPLSLHMVFTGNPGTGKTTVARLIGEIYREIGILRTGQLVEVDRAGLVGEYLGQTGPKTREVFNQARGGVLFIDEAYSLVAGDEDSDQYGQEAVDTLLKLMEDHRDDVLVIAAGYIKEMEKFVSSNPGLRSRFTRTIVFEDYNAKELTEIFYKTCKLNAFKLSRPVLEKVYQAMLKKVASKSSQFGNAREVRSYFEQTMQNHANRLSAAGNHAVDALQELLPEDIPA